jgi:hypothetical protein
MAECCAGRVVRVPLGAAFRSKKRLLESALSSLDGVSVFFIDYDEGMVTACVDDVSADESDIVRALAASGTYCMSGPDSNNRSEDGSRVC